MQNAIFENKVSYDVREVEFYIIIINNKFLSLPMPFRNI